MCGCRLRLCWEGAVTVSSYSAICPEPSEVNHFPIDHYFTDNTYTSPKETEVSLIIVHQVHRHQHLLMMTTV